MLGEKLVLAANGQQGVATCALRPSTVFGEYDTLFLPTLVAKAKQGKMKYYFGTAIQDWTYAGNIAHACVLVRCPLLHTGSMAGARTGSAGCCWLAATTVTCTTAAVHH